MNNAIYGNMPYQDMNLLNEMFIQNNLNAINKMNGNYDYNDNFSNELAGSYDGYLKGNMFNNLYKEYKNYKPAKLIPNNEQAEILLNLNQASFALHDVRLYLDTHPDDKNMINIFNKYSSKLKEITDNYEKKYGPIMCDTQSNNNNFSWEAYSFPWEMEEM